VAGTKLLDQVRIAIRHPGEMGAVDVNEFLTHLAIARNVSASTQNQTASALLFLYRHVLHRRSTSRVVSSARGARGTFMSF